MLSSAQWAEIMGLCSMDGTLGSQKSGFFSAEAKVTDLEKVREKR